MQFCDQKSMAEWYCNISISLWSIRESEFSGWYNATWLLLISLFFVLSTTHWLPFDSLSESINVPDPKLHHRTALQKTFDMITLNKINSNYSFLCVNVNEPSGHTSYSHFHIAHIIRWTLSLTDLIMSRLIAKPYKHGRLA